MPIGSIREGVAPALPETPNLLPVPQGEAASGPSPFARALAALGHEAERGEATVKRTLAGASAGGSLDPAQLLALQAGIYRYSQVIDLASKLVDHASTDVRTVIQQQS